MRKLDVVSLRELVGGLNLATGFLITGQDKPIGGMRPTIISSLQQLRPRLEALNLPFSLMDCDRLIEELGADQYPQTKEVVIRLDGLAERVNDELTSFSFFEVPADKLKYYEHIEPLFGDSVSISFPSANPEIEEAGKCLALGRYSATVYHLMRALEVGLACLAKPHGVDFTNTNWHTVLDQIEAKVKAMSSVTHGPTWKTDQQFYASAAVHFRMIKDAWRNYAMHLHERYDEERALEIWQTVRAFMRHLAKELHE